MVAAGRRVRGHLVARFGWRADIAAMATRAVRDGVWEFDGVVVTDPDALVPAGCVLERVAR
jgi:hypothetical protein